MNQKYYIIFQLFFKDLGLFLECLLALPELYVYFKMDDGEPTSESLS